MAIGVRRRTFMTMLVGAATLAGDVIVWAAQQVPARAPDEQPRVMFLSVGEEGDPAIRNAVVAFEQWMRAAGWAAGVNIRLDYRWAGTDQQRATAAAAEIAALRPTVILTAGAAVTLAMQRATSTIPIVFSISVRSDRPRSCIEPCASWRQHNRLQHLRAGDGRQVAGSAQEDSTPHGAGRGNVQSSDFAR
jgi:hypothetical protein